MPVIDYGAGVRRAVRAGTSVLEASLAAGLAHAHACGGNGRCTTCRVRVEDGHAHCPPADALEAEALRSNGLEPPIRLACRLRPTGDVAVRILTPEHRAPERGAPEAVEEHVAVLFTDIRGFTAFSESHLPFDVANVLNRYFDTMGVQVERHGGYILDYLGDGIMTLFRPDPSGTPERRALHCALAMRERARRFCAWVHDHHGAALAIGSAIHAGRAVVGELGYFRERHLNAVGDVLNVAARLEDLNRDLDSDILVSEAVAEACAGLAPLGRSIAVKVRGRTTPLTAFEVLED